MHGQAEIRLNLGKWILLIYVDNLQKKKKKKNMEKYYTITLNWKKKNQTVKSLHITHKHNYAKMCIEKWQEGNSPHFNTDFLWWIILFSSFTFSAFIIFIIEKRQILD